MDAPLAERVTEALRQSHPRGDLAPIRAQLDDYETVLFAHADFVALYRRRDIDFVYDDAACLYLVGAGTFHACLMQALYRYRLGGAWGNSHDDADAFIMQGLGMFKSTAAHRIWHGPGFRVPRELLCLRRDFEVLS